MREIFKFRCLDIITVQYQSGKIDNRMGCRQQRIYSTSLLLIVTGGRGGGDKGGRAQIFYGTILTG